MKKAANVVVERLRERLTPSPADALYDFDSFKKLFGGASDVFDDVALSDLDLKVLIKFLTRDQKAVVVDRNVSRRTH